MLEIFSSDNYF